MYAGFGIWMAFKRRDLLSVFALIIALSAVYVSGGFGRLLIYASIGIIAMASIGLHEVVRSILQKRESAALTAISRADVDLLTDSGNNRKVIKVVSIIIIIFTLCFPLMYPRNINWLTSADIPPPIITDGRGIPSQTNDWIDALNWISNNTPTNSVIASWWDYGYWIETLGNRTTLADNANFRIIRTVTLAKMLIDQEENGITIAQKLGADYILIYLEAERFNAPNGSSFYTFGYGGDESKMLGIMRIAGLDDNKYLEPDLFTPTPLFWNMSLLGKLLPLSSEGYAKLNNGELTNFSDHYTPGSIALYSKEVKYPDNNIKTQQPLRLVFSSDSFKNNNQDMMTAVLIYEVNHDFHFLH
jgi:dolichyl-diphosphooligosaccharide--protein glycosyltransferase